VHYYDHNIADYRKDTGHLSITEHGIYRQMLDSYYLDEKPLCIDHAKLMRSHCVRTADEVQAFENVLSDFFIRTDKGYIHKRCDVVIAAYHAKSTKAGESAKARWDRVRAEKDANAMRTHSEGNANHKPITNNQKIKPTAQIPSGFSRFWAEYPKKKSKGDAEKAFKAIKPSEQELEAILQAIERAKTSADWLKDGGQFIPYPATWLRAKGWEDVIESGMVIVGGQIAEWWKSASGFETHGRSIGVSKGENEPFPAYKLRVLKAAGDGPWVRT
jgi:uncharacterized protein YdaU (DUF1376 family)